MNDEAHRPFDVAESLATLHEDATDSADRSSRPLAVCPSLKRKRRRLQRFLRTWPIARLNMESKRVSWKEPVDLAGSTGDLQVLDRARLAGTQLVIRAVGRVWDARIDPEDAFQEGYAAMITALRRMARRQPSQNKYPYWHCRDEVIRAVLRAQNAKRYLVPMPAAVRRAAVQRRDARRTFRAAHGRPPTSVELAASSGLSELQLQEVEEAMPFVRKTIAVDQVADQVGAEGPELHRTNARVLAIALRSLRPRELEVLRKRFGLGGLPVMTLEEIGIEWGFTRERVRQLESLGLQKLRWFFSTTGGRQLL